MNKRTFESMPKGYPFIKLTLVVWCLLTYFTPDLLTWIFLRAHHLAMSEDLRRVLLYMHAGLIGLFLAMMGSARASIPHPRLNPPYSNWLKTTPWHAGIPLPLGPIWLNFYDLGLLLVVGLLLKYTTHLQPELVLFPFGITYFLYIMRHLLSTGPARATYILAFGLLGVARALPHLLLASLILVALYPVAHWAIDRSLQSFPWEPLVPKNKVPLGWTFERLGPEAPNLRISPVDVLLISSLVGATVYVIFYQSIAEIRPELTAILIGAGAVASLGRLTVYRQGLRNPLGIIARLATGHLIIPGFDRVYVAPLCAVLLLIVPLYNYPSFRTFSPLSAAALTAAATFVLLGMGPTIREFRLTGKSNVSTRYEAILRDQPSTKLTSS